MIDGQNFFDQPVKNNSETYDSILKFAAGQLVRIRESPL